jgi:hypothetical protein
MWTCFLSFFHFVSFLPQFCFSCPFATLFYHCFSYPLLIMLSLCFILFISLSFSASVSFRPITSISLYFCYILSFLISNRILPSSRIRSGVATYHDCIFILLLESALNLCDVCFTGSIHVFKWYLIIHPWMSLVLTVTNGKHICYYKNQHLSQAYKSVICNMLVWSKQGLFFRPYLIKGSVIQQWVFQGPVTHMFNPVQCKLLAVL